MLDATIFIALVILRVLFTLAMLVVYRIGFWIPLPGIDQEQMAQTFRTASESGSAFAGVASYVAIFSGGSFSQSTIFGLGIMRRRLS